MIVHQTDENGCGMELRYSLTESEGFYGVGVTMNGEEHSGATFTRDRGIAESLLSDIAQAEVTPTTFFDVIRDRLLGL